MTNADQLLPAVDAAEAQKNSVKMSQHYLQTKNYAGRRNKVVSYTDQLLHNAKEVVLARSWQPLSAFFSSIIYIFIYYNILVWLDGLITAQSY